TSAMEFDSNKEINQVISIHEPNMYRASIHNNIILKQEYVHGFGIAKSSSLRKWANNMTNNGNSTQHHCENYYRTGHYSYM
ncbi:22444_t:CDS:2, partial [Gigaspora rosea]